MPLRWPADKNVEIKESNIDDACFGVFTRNMGFEAREYITGYPGTITNDTPELDGTYAVSLEIDSYFEVGFKTEAGIELVNTKALMETIAAQNASFFQAGDTLIPNEGAVCYGSRANDLSYLPNITLPEYTERGMALSNALLVPVFERHENGSYILHRDMTTAVFAWRYIPPYSELSIEYGFHYWGAAHGMKFCPQVSIDYFAKMDESVTRDIISFPGGYCTYGSLA
jgi:hypothetical protein